MNREEAKIFIKDNLKDVVPEHRIDLYTELYLLLTEIDYITERLKANIKEVE